MGIFHEFCVTVHAPQNKPRSQRSWRRFREAHVKDLMEKLNTNSRNSSKSPSQDPYRARKCKKKPSEKKQGAQMGHEGPLLKEFFQ